MSDAPVYCHLCLKEGKRVELERAGKFYYHKRGERGRSCSVTAFVQLPQPEPLKEMKT